MPPFEEERGNDIAAARNVQVGKHPPFQTNVVDENTISKGVVLQYKPGKNDQSRHFDSTQIKPSKGFLMKKLVP